MNTQKRPSLQSIRKNRQKREFVGRDEQISQFRQNLTFDIENEQRKFIFNITGQGGIGKTTLLRCFSKIAEDAHAITAWTDEADENVPIVMKHLVEQLEQQDHTFKKFNESYHLYRQRRQELEADPEAPKTSLDFVSHLVTKIGVSFGKQIPVGGALFDFIDEDAFASQVSEWSAYVKRKLTNKDDIRLVQEPLEVLTPLFIEGLQKIAEKHLIALFFDTYEYTGRYLDEWIRKLWEGHYGDIPPNIVISIAGRDELDTNLWIAYEGELTHFPLEPFTEQEARELLRRKGIVDEKVTKIILQQSHRFPLLVASLALSNPINLEQIEEVNDTAVERILKWENEKQRQVALNAALPLVLNQDVLASLVGNDNAEPFFQWLKQKPFIKQRTDGWVYHDGIRKPMLHHKLRQSPQSWSAIHGQLAEYYEGLRDNLGLRIKQGPYNSEWNNYTLQIIYHRACQNPHNFLWIALKIHGPVMQFAVSEDTLYRRWEETINQVVLDAEITEQEYKKAVLELHKELKEAVKEWNVLREQQELYLVEVLEEVNKNEKEMEQYKEQVRELEDKVKQHKSISKEIDERILHKYKNTLKEIEQEKEELAQKLEKFKGESVQKLEKIQEKLQQPPKFLVERLGFINEDEI